MKRGRILMKDNLPAPNRINRLWLQVTYVKLFRVSDDPKKTVAEVLGGFRRRLRAVRILSAHVLYEEINR